MHFYRARLNPLCVFLLLRALLAPKRIGWRSRLFGATILRSPTPLFDGFGDGRAMRNSRATMLVGRWPEAEDPPRCSPSPRSLLLPSRFGSTSLLLPSTARRRRAGLSCPPWNLHLNRTSLLLAQSYGCKSHAHRILTDDAHMACIVHSCVYMKASLLTQDRGNTIQQNQALFSCTAYLATSYASFVRFSSPDPMHLARNFTGGRRRVLTRQPPSLPPVILCLPRRPTRLS